MPIDPTTSPSSAQALLERLASPERLAGLRDARGRSLLMAAIEDNDVSMVSFLAPRSDLIEQIKVSVDEPPRTPLMLAAHLGRTDCVQALLQHRPQEQCVQGHHERPFPALDQALNAGHVDIVALLAPWSDLAKRRQLHPMISAATMGRLDMVQVLLPFCPLNARDQYGNNALGAAVSEYKTSPERDACVELLLQQPGIEVLLPHHDRHTNNPTGKVLFDAINHHQVHAVRELLPYFDVNAFYQNGDRDRWTGMLTPLHAAGGAHDVACLNLLLPLSDQAWNLRQSLPSSRYQDEHNTTPVEFALARLEHIWDHNWEAQLRVADTLVAHGLQRGLPTPMPAFKGRHGQALGESEKRDAWPLTFAVLEAIELNGTVNTVLSETLSSKNRARL